MSTFVSVARVGDIPEGSARACSVAGHNVAIFNCGGQLYATDNICSHDYAQLHDGYVDGDDCTVECPLHGSLFDLRTGAARTLPATQPVKVYQLRVEGDEIQIEVPGS
jgi:3-phenylpropionate/trans-cinnamate dioxygenase ferredoxin component